MSLKFLKQFVLEMGFLDLFCAASMPVLKVLIVTALGLFLALDSINILGQTTRKNVNEVSLITNMIKDFKKTASLLKDSTFSSYKAQYFEL